MTPEKVATVEDIAAGCHLFTRDKRSQAGPLQVSRVLGQRRDRRQRGVGYRVPISFCDQRAASSGEQRRASANPQGASPNLGSEVDAVMPGESLPIQQRRALQIVEAAPHRYTEPALQASAVRNHRYRTAGDRARRHAVTLATANRAW